MSKIHNIKFDKLASKIEKITSDLILVLADKKVLKAHSFKTELSALENKEVKIIELDASEKIKSFTTYKKVLNDFLKGGAHRNAHLLAIGGGTISDLGGFVASSLLRGISWSVIPTSLLSMIDAAIGGKTGINIDEGKNLVGSFHLPENIFLCTDFLNTLSSEEHSSGSGEILKYAYLNKKIYQHLMTLNKQDELIYKCAKYKQSIVEKDFKEGKLRKILNLGHTFGHAYEKMYKIPHGQAVMWGILTIELLGGRSDNDFRELCARLGLNKIKTPWAKISLASVMKYLKMDKKKVNNDEIDILIIDDIGKIKIERHLLTSLKDDFKEIKHVLEKFSF